jgi:hypothetical protein
MTGGNGDSSKAQEPTLEEKNQIELELRREFQKAAEEFNDLLKKANCKDARQVLTLFNVPTPEPLGELIAKMIEHVAKKIQKGTNPGQAIGDQLTVAVMLGSFLKGRNLI